MKGTMIILVGKNVNHDNESLEIRALLNDETAQKVMKKAFAESKAEQDKWLKDCSTGSESYCDVDYAEPAGKPIFVIVRNELTNKGAGCYIYGVCETLETARKLYSQQIKEQNEYWQLGEVAHNKEAMQDTDTVIAADYADGSNASMEFACVRVIPDGETVSVTF